ncbi:18332_t:CDS:2, partial [Gigaspora margarita]
TDPFYPIDDIPILVISKASKNYDTILLKIEINIKIALRL